MLTRMELLISRIAEWLYSSSIFAINYKLQVQLHALITELFLNIQVTNNTKVGIRLSLAGLRGWSVWQ